MAKRKIIFTSGEYYHVYNRGVEKRNIFADKYDVERFIQSMTLFNSIEPIGSIYENSFKNPELGGGSAKSVKSKKLLEYIAHCENTNHFHLIVKQLKNGGVIELMKRLGGYSWYFNNRYKRVGPLFQGPFKAIHINSNDYLLHLSVYVNLNYLTHKLSGSALKLVRSSWEEYINDETKGFCAKDIILDQFKNRDEYKEFAKDALKIILERKSEDGFKELLLD